MFQDSDRTKCVRNIEINLGIMKPLGENMGEKLTDIDFWKSFLNVAAKQSQHK